MAGFLVLAVLAGCGERTSVATPFKATDITGVDFGKNFRLTDHNGKARRLADFRGKVVVLFFGYTHCPDVCPTTLSDLSLAMKRLGSDAGKVQVLFVTLDPERDTPALLAQFVPAFDSNFLGLYGNADATAGVAREFKIFYQKQESASKAGYTLDHSAGTYVFDQTGRLRLLMSYGQGAEAMAQDIRALLYAAR